MDKTETEERRQKGKKEWWPRIGPFTFAANLLEIQAEQWKVDPADSVISLLLFRG